MGAAVFSSLSRAALQLLVYGSICGGEEWRIATSPSTTAKRSRVGVDSPAFDSRDECSTHDSIGDCFSALKNEAKHRKHSKYLT